MRLLSWGSTDTLCYLSYKGRVVDNKMWKSTTEPYVA